MTHPRRLLSFAFLAFLFSGVLLTANAKPPSSEVAVGQEPKADAKEAPKPNPLDEVKKSISDMDKAVKDASQRGDSAWMLAASAFVMFMLPGLALFYGGMVRKKNILATMMQSYAALAVVGVYWIVCGYGLAFGPSIIKVDFLGVKEGGIIGWHPDLFFLKNITVDQLLPNYGITVYLHCMFQGMFAIITPALISGAVAERIRFWPFCIYMILWVTVVYCPLAHMVWAADFFYDDPLDGKQLGASPIGLLGKLGALDFAGGTVVHIAAGTAGLACCLGLRRRLGYPKTVVHPNSMVLTLLGAGLLWFGWFGFNGGSALNSTSLAGSAFAATQAAAAAAGLSWVFVEWLFTGKPTALGMASGIVAGLVAVTPASGFVYMWGGVAIGVIAGIVCFLAVRLKGLFGYDDSLDAFGVHAVGGFLGAVLTGVFCYAAIQSGSADGYFAMPTLKERPAAIDKEIAAIKAKLPELEKGAKEAEGKLKEATDKKAPEKEIKEFQDALDAETGKVTRRTDKIKALEEEKGNTEKKLAEYKEKDRGPMTQVIIQCKAATFSLVFAFVVSFVLVFVVQILTLGNFTTTKSEEIEGLDTTEHGEIGFDFGLGIEASGAEPKPAKVPPGGKRFRATVEGVETAAMLKAWTELCQPVANGPVDQDFRAVYSYITTVKGNTFHFRGGDPKKLAEKLGALFKKKLGKSITVVVHDE